MTHTLHPEIQDAVDKLVSEITKLKPWYYNADCLLDLERMILKCVGKYLSLPKSTPQIELPAYVLNNLDYLWLLLDKMIEKSKSHLDKLKSLDK